MAEYSWVRHADLSSAVCITNYVVRLQGGRQHVEIRCNPYCDNYTLARGYLEQLLALPEVAVDAWFEPDVNFVIRYVADATVDVSHTGSSIHVRSDVLEVLRAFDTALRIVGV